MPEIKDNDDGLERGDKQKPDAVQKDAVQKDAVQKPEAQKPALTPENADKPNTELPVEDGAGPKDTAEPKDAVAPKDTETPKEGAEPVAGSRAAARRGASKPTKNTAAPKADKAEKSAKADKSAKAEKSVKADKPPIASKAGKAERRTKTKVRRRWPAVVAGTATLAVAVAAVGAGTLFPALNATGQTEVVPYRLPVGEALANCPGPTQLLAGSAEGTDPEFSPNASGTTTALSALALSSAKGALPDANVQALDGNNSQLFELSKAAESAEADPKAVTGKPKMRAAVVRGNSVDGPSALRMSPLEGELPVGAASVVVDAADGDLKGLAAASCQTPSNELWLTGASTTVGRTSVLAISNSSPSAATVSLEMNTNQGPLQAAGGKGLVVAPGQVKSVVLAGLAPDQDLLSIHVKSTGGAVTAVIQQSVLRGLTPGGVDYLAPVQAPSTSMAIPGVWVQAPDAAAKISDQDGYADATAALAITVPGARDSVVEVKAYGSDGQVALPGGGVFTATAGTVNLMPLKGLPAGTYSLSLKADEAVTATARLVRSTKAGEGVDIAFAPSTARLGAAHLLSLPQDLNSALVFSAPDDAATVRLVPISESGELGAAKDVDVQAGRTMTLSPASVLGDKAVGVLISVAGAPVYGSQLLLGNDSANIAVLPIPGGSAGSADITMVTGY